MVFECYVPDNTSDPQTAQLSFTYDAPGVSYSKGRLTQVASTTPTSAVSTGGVTSTNNILNYDPLGRVASSNQATQGVTYGVSYGYNLAGALTSETLPSNRVIQTGYDAANRPVWLQGTAASGGLQTKYIGNQAGADTTSFSNWIQYAPHGAV